MKPKARTRRRTGARMWADQILRASVRLCVCALLTSCGRPSPGAEKAYVYIPRGATLSAVVDSLTAHQVVESPGRFEMYARIKGLTRRVRPGLYEFLRGERWSTIVSALRTGRTFDFFLTVPEGLTVEEIAELASRRLRLAPDSVQRAVRDSFLAAARDPSLAGEFAITVQRGAKEPLEGYLFPETYRVSFDATPRDLVRQMLRQFHAMWDTSWDRRAARLALTRHQAVTLASIVEAEARVGSERRTIAGVYLNRLRRRMLLQADPTVIYALDEPVTRVLYRHLRVNSPYNTYRRSGLPPGPIGNPGRAALEATLDPELHDYFFFVARPDGTHMFSRTQREHADSVAVARRLRAEAEARRDSIALSQAPPARPQGRN